MINDCVNAPVGISDEIQRYQKTLENVGAKLDFCYGIDLYLAPSYMSLNIGRQRTWYNNEILVATDDLTIGRNDTINEKIIPKGANTGEKGVFTPQLQDKPTTTEPATPTTTPATTTPAGTVAQEHNDNKSL